MAKQAYKLIMRIMYPNFWIKKKTNLFVMKEVDLGDVIKAFQ